jgi:hypothetical protein
MRRIAALAASAAMASVPLVLSTSSPAQAQPDCRDIVIGVGGNGERQAHKFEHPTMMDAHMAQAQAEGKRTLSIDYKSSVWPTGAYTKDESVVDGRQKLNQAVAAYRAECPGGKVTVIGHSLGSEVVQGTEGADKTIVYGDPRTSNGIYSALPGVYPGTSNPGVRNAEADGVVSVCREFDAICDSPAPWSDPAKFVQGWAGYFMGWHGYAPNEGADLPPGEHMIEAPAPLPWLPESTPTGIPEAPPLPGIPEWQPGPIPSLEDVQPVLEVFTPQPYKPTPIVEFTPEYIDPILPPEVAAYVPPPIEQIIPPLPALPPLPEVHIPGLF